MVSAKLLLDKSSSRLLHDEARSVDRPGILATNVRRSELDSSGLSWVFKKQPCVLRVTRVTHLLHYMLQLQKSTAPI